MNLSISQNNKYNKITGISNNISYLRKGNQTKLFILTIFIYFISAR